MSEKLLPCPFCGGDARLGGGPLAQECFSVWCSEPDCRHHMDGNLNYSETVEKWNRRAPAAPATPAPSSHAISKAWAERMLPLDEGATPSAGAPTPARDDLRAGVYIASKARYGSEWVSMRDSGYPIISTWIDECGQGATSDWADLWERCIREASSASAVVVIEREGDEPRGALVEVGAALAKGVPVFAVGVSKGTWHRHSGVTVVKTEGDAFRAALHDAGGTDGN